MHKKQGFSLIELMIVVLIIGILAAIVIPNYSYYIQRSRFAEVIVSTHPYKLAIALALQEGDRPSTLNSGEHGVPLFTTPTSNVANITVKQSIITATATQAAGGYTYILTPNEFGSNWDVSGTCLDVGVCNL